MGNKSNRKPPKDTAIPPETKQEKPDTLKLPKAFINPDTLASLKVFVARIVEASREIVEAHQEIDSGLTKAIEFWEKRKPEWAAVYRELRDALREADVANVPEVFMKGTAATRSRVATRKRWEGRDKLTEQVRAKARELQAERPRSQRALRTYLAKNSEKLFGTKLSESTIRRYIGEAGDT